MNRKRNPRPYDCGIYRIVCDVNNKIYIGSTIGLHQREIDHFSKLNRDTHDNIHIKNAVIKYGSDKFIFEVMELCNKDLLPIREKYWMDFYDTTNHSKGFNIAKDTVCPSRGSKRSVDSIKKMVDGHRKIFKFINSQGQVVEIPNLKEFCKERNFRYSSFISLNRLAHAEYCCGGWRKFDEKLVGVPFVKEDIKKLDLICKHWKIIDPYGEVKEFDNLRKFERKNKLRLGSLNHVAAGRVKHYKGWRMFSINNISVPYVEKLKALKVSKAMNRTQPRYFGLIDPQGNKHEGFGIKKFCKENKLNYRGIRTILNSNKAFVNGWRKYKKELVGIPFVMPKHKGPDKGNDFNFIFGGEIYTGNNIRRFCKEKEISYGMMMNLEKGRIEEYKGWKLNKEAALAIHNN